MKILTIIWLLIIVVCILEAYFYTTFDTESEEFLNKRENEYNEN